MDVPLLGSMLLRRGCLLPSGDRMTMYLNPCVVMGSGRSPRVISFDCNNIQTRTIDVMYTRAYLSKVVFWFPLPTVLNCDIIFPALFSIASMESCRIVDLHVESGCGSKL